MAPVASASLLSALQQLTDPRHRRGVRHPFPGVLAVIFLGLLRSRPDFASIARWATRHHLRARGRRLLRRRVPWRPGPMARSSPEELVYGLDKAPVFAVREFRPAGPAWTFARPNWC